MAVSDANLAIQKMVENSIGDDLNGFQVQRKVALNYMLDGYDYYVKVLICFDCPRNCVHVKIREQNVGFPVYIGRHHYRKTVADPLVKCAIHPEN